VLTLAALEKVLAARGLTPRGAFHPTAIDEVPALADGSAAATLVLAGNAGPAMWDAFARARGDDPRLAGDHALDEFSRIVLGEIAGEFGALALLPNDGPPYYPFQRWAMRAEPLFASPLGILIHPEYGLWHGYRGALAFAEALDLPPPDARPSPCATCEDRPCLSTCPVGAFKESGTGSDYDVQACIAHIEAAEGADCREEGCRARRACPVGRDFIYAPAQAAFHTAAFVKAYRRR
jgi:hypothetical protein